MAQKRVYQKHLRSLQQSMLAKDILQGKSILIILKYKNIISLSELIFSTKVPNSLLNILEISQYQKMGIFSSFTWTFTFSTVSGCRFLFCLCFKKIPLIVIV